jgi:hypothetical protein
MIEQTARDLEAALALIPEGKWGKGLPMSRSPHCLCTLEAIELVVDEDFNRYIAAREALFPIIGESAVIDWNDAPERTHAEVVEAFQKAIAAERAKG